MGLLIDWTTKALCQEGDPDALFVQGAEQNNAKKVCRGCPVRLECLADALDNRIEFGVWGGMTERERRALLRKHADVRSWRAVFEVALEDEQRSARKSRRRIPVNVNVLPATSTSTGRPPRPDGEAVSGAFSCPVENPSPCHQAT
nr:WhiB family transcriptional regulator [Glycomyces sp. TRM65418]QZD54238.1 WhiB family transcriptional regulator [Glycomyces sp. TRM65418]